MTPPAPFDEHRLPPAVSPLARQDPRHIGGYRIVGRIGAGGMGSVYAGLDNGGRAAAVKVVLPEHADQPAFRARFAREAALVERVRSTCTAGFLAADVDAPAPWLAIEYVPGRTLRRHVADKGPLHGGNLVALAVGLAEALSAIHSVGVVHRDLKPGNVILAPDGPKVLDFGISRAVDLTALTRTGELSGTPGWVSPEQYDGLPATERSDVHAWGALVAFAATGRAPFGTGDAHTLARRVREADPDLEGVPPELLPLVRRALLKDLGERPDAERLLDDLVGQWNATSVVPVDPGRPRQAVPTLVAAEWTGFQAPQARRVGRRRRFLWAAAAMAAAVPLVAATLFLGPRGDASGQADGGYPAGTGQDDPSWDPRDGRAAVEQALDLALDAPSFEVMYGSRSTHEWVGGSGSYRYTQEPEPVHHFMHLFGEGSHGGFAIGEGAGGEPEDIIHWLGQREGAEDIRDTFYRTEGEHPYMSGEEAGREGAFAPMTRMVEGEGEIEYLGEEPVPEVELPQSDLVEVSEADVSDRSGHAYTSEGTNEDGEFQAYELWVDDSGYPLVMQDFSESEYTGNSGETDDVRVTMSYVYVHFGGDVEIELPDESEIGPPPSHIEE
ncbi:serine/threonine protein kinase [Nocardiopsis nanhaiensis]